MSEKNETDVIIKQAERHHGPQPGDRYRHWKGGEYVIVCRSVNEATLEHLVTYRSESRGYVWTRTLADFCGFVDGTLRFEYLG